MYPAGTINIYIDAMKNWGITDPIVQAALLAIVWKETAFSAKVERGYQNTSNARIRQVFSRNEKIQKMSDAELNELKSSERRFFNFLYGGRYGNTQPDDGYKFRGRGPNGITFHDNYKNIGNALNVDLVNYPDRINEPRIAAQALAIYFRDAFKLGASARPKGYQQTYLKLRAGINNISEAKDLETAVRAAIFANAGWGIDPNHPIVIEGTAKAMAVVEDMYGFTKKKTPGATQLVPEQPLQ